MPNHVHYMTMSPWSSPNGLLFTTNFSSGFVPTSAATSGHRGGKGMCVCSVHGTCCAKLWIGVNSNEWFCAGVHAAILAWDIYFAKTNPEYDTQTKIEIRSLTQPLTFKMGSSIFMAMSKLKVASKTWTSFTIIPQMRELVEKVDIWAGLCLKILYVVLAIWECPFGWYTTLFRSPCFTQSLSIEVMFFAVTPQRGDHWQ